MLKRRCKFVIYQNSDKQINTLLGIRNNSITVTVMFQVYLDKSSMSRVRMFLIVILLWKCAFYSYCRKIIFVSRVSFYNFK